MSIKYIIVMKLQATCLPDQPRDPYQRKLEIIEFPAVLLNLATGKIEEDFHEFVKPTENPILTSDCVQITGVHQSSVDKAFILQDILILFDLWLTSIFEERNLRLPTSYWDRNYNCAIATWTGHDLNCFLRLETQRKQIPLKHYLHIWIDLKHIFKTKYNLGKFDYKDAFKYMNLKCKEFNAQSLAKLVYEMFLADCKLEPTSAMF